PSRRQHTRLQANWSSDVCSSDLDAPDAAVDVRAYREPGDGWKPSREIIGKVRFRCQRVETADGPRVVPGVERVNEVHQFLVADNALKTGLRVVARLVEIDRRANQLRAAEHCEPGLHERQREAVALRFVELTDDEPLASVVLDMR